MEQIAGVVGLLNALLELLKNCNIDIKYVIAILIVLGIIMFYQIKKIKKANSIAHNQMVMSNKCQEIYYKMMNSYKSRIKAEQFNLMMMDEFKSLLNQIAEMFTIITNKDVYSTIRFLEQRKTINKSKVNVLQHSENCERNRVAEFNRILKKEVNIEKTVEKNSDFYEIIGEGRENLEPYFYQSNLKKYSKKLKKLKKKEYQNETNNWEDYYLGRIVVPIRMANNKLFFKDTNKGYDLIGFLTIDSKSKYAFSERNHIKNFYLSILETYSAYLYIILNNYMHYLKKLEEGENI